MLLFFSLCAQYFLNVRGGGGITTLGPFRTFRKPCVARCQNGKLCRFWVLVGDAPEERRKPSEQRCAYARRCSEGVAAPLGCVIFLQFGDVAVFSLCAQGLLHSRGKGKHHHSRRVSHVVETPGARLSKRLTFASMVRSGDTYPPSLKESHVTSHTLKERALLLRPQLSSDLPLDFVATAFVVWYNLI